MATVVVSGDRTQKWVDIGPALGEPIVLIQCSGAPAEVLTECHRLTPCVLVVDNSFLDQVDSEEFYRKVDFGRCLRVLVELEEHRLAEGERLIRIGCAGYLSKSASPAEACRALRAVLDGELWARRSVIARVLQNVLRESKHRITFRESEILGLISEGLKNSEIAKRLFISPQTVRWHLRSLYAKLGTHDRFRAITHTPRFTGGSVLPGKLPEPIRCRRVS